MSSTFFGDETTAALIFSCMGAAYGTAKSGVGVASMGVMRPELVMKSVVLVVMAGVFGIYESSLIFVTGYFRLSRTPLRDTLVQAFVISPLGLRESIRG
ncbi:V-type proton ATPase 16 kDa proteolipid subunit-like protein [Tanacetum coccineum]